MRKNESVKRLIILCLSFLGIILSTGIYAYTWIVQYHQRCVFNVKLYFWGHILMVFIYFVLLFFFNTTYGGLKIGFLKPMDVFFSQGFSLLCVNVITYLQISLMEVKLVWTKGIIWMTVIQIVVAGIWTQQSFHTDICRISVSDVPYNAAHLTSPVYHSGFRFQSAVRRRCLHCFQLQLREGV